MMPPMKITSITTANIKKVLSMVTPFVRTRHATKWYSTAHPPKELRPIEILSPGITLISMTSIRGVMSANNLAA
jgi:hypothetical protein